MFKTVMMFELEQTMKKNAVNVLDVREDYEYHEGHIPGAINTPISDFMSYTHLVDKKKPYYVVCYSGARSQIVAKYLGQQGYDVTNVLGGMSTYKGTLSDEV